MNIDLDGAMATDHGDVIVITIIPDSSPAAYDLAAAIRSLPTTLGQLAQDEVHEVQEDEVPAAERGMV